MIQELVIISGKGGTGKTSVAASLACLASDKVIADCDVDAADMHLILKPEVKKTTAFEDSSKAGISSALCTSCGICLRYCRFNAISADLVVDSIACEGCGVCAHFCPAGAIEMVRHESGHWFVSETRHGPMVYARLGIAEGNSGRLVTLIKKEAREIARNRGYGLIIVDGSPGTGCPVIASITGATHVLVVTEPTVSGLHDLERVLDLARHFNVQASVCVNKCDINADKTREIGELCDKRQVPFLARIPYDDDFTRAQMAGQSLVEYSRGAAAAAVRDLWESLSREYVKTATHE
jgi:MinD superfamily P-loop ATPase